MTANNDVSLYIYIISREFILIIRMGDLKLSNGIK